MNNDAYQFKYRFISGSLWLTNHLPWPGNL